MEYTLYGNLKPGVYDMSWDEFKAIFSFNEHRSKMFLGLELAISELKAVGCKLIYIDGSFVTKIEHPNDFDLCWDEDGVNYELLKGTFKGLMDFGYKMQTMKERYGGDIVPMTHIADFKKGITFLWFFQNDKQRRQKGIIRISLIN